MERIGMGSGRRAVSDRSPLYLHLHLFHSIIYRINWYMFWRWERRVGGPGLTSLGINWWSHLSLKMKQRQLDCSIEEEFYLLTLDCFLGWANHVTQPMHFIQHPMAISLSIIPEIFTIVLSIVSVRGVSSYLLMRFTSFVIILKSLP